MDVRIRQAVADDAPFLGWVIFTAGRSHCPRGVWDVIVGRPESECITFLEHLTVTEPRHMFYYSDFIIAEVEGRPVAALSGYDPTELTDVAGPLVEVFGKPGVMAGKRADNSKGVAAIVHCYPDNAEGAWVIESVATVPEFRRRGIIDTLLNEILQKGRGLGYALGQVGVFIGNTAAQRAYEKCGFAIVDEKRHPDFEAEIGCPGMARLHMDL